MIENFPVPPGSCAPQNGSSNQKQKSRVKCGLPPNFGQKGGLVFRLVDFASTPPKRCSGLDSPMSGVDDSREDTGHEFLLPVADSRWQTEEDLSLE